MSWDFGATGKQISRAIDQHGMWSARGRGWHYSRPDAGDYSYLESVRKITEIGWSIYSAGALPTHVDLLGKGFAQYAAENQNRTCSMISYHPGEPPLLSFVVVTSKDAGFMYYDLIKLIFGTSHRFECSLNFIGFREPHVDALDILSVAEFTHQDSSTRRVHVSDEVSLRIRQSGEDE